MGTDLYLKLLIIDTLVDIWHQKKKKKKPGMDIYYME